MRITPGSTDVSLYVYFRQDAGGTDPGEPATGLLFSDIETGGSASYVRQGAARTDLTLITLASASATHADGGFILVDDTNMPGLYRVDIPDAMVATGVDLALLQLVAAGANNVVMSPLQVELSLEPVTAAANADAVWDEAMAGHQAEGSFGLVNQAINSGTAAGGAAATITLDSNASASLEFYKGSTIDLPEGGGTGAGQSRLIINYAVATKVATVSPAWTIQPVSGTKYVVRGNVGGAVENSLIEAGLTMAITTIATLASQTSFTLTAGSADDDAYNGCWCVVTDITTAVQKAIGYISDYTGSSRTVTLIADPGIFTMAQNDKIAILPRAFSQLLVASQASLDAIELDTAALADTTTGEPAQGAPPETATLKTKIDWIYKVLRNKKEQTSTLWSLYDAAGTTVDSKATVSDAAGTATKEEIVTGP